MLYDWCHDHNILPRVKLRPTLNEEAFSVSSTGIRFNLWVHSLVHQILYALYKSMNIYILYNYSRLYKVLGTMAEVSSAWLNELFQASLNLDHQDGWIQSFQKHSQYMSRLEPPSGEWQWTRWKRHQKTIHQTFFWWRNEGQRMAREFTRRARKWHQYSSIGPRGTRLDGEWPWRDPSMKNFGSCSRRVWVSGKSRPSLVLPTTALLIFILIPLVCFTVDISEACL